MFSKTAPMNFTTDLFCFVYCFSISAAEGGDHRLNRIFLPDFVSKNSLSLAEGIRSSTAPASVEITVTSL
jgi:hypothetical protein